MMIFYPTTELTFYNGIKNDKNLFYFFMLRVRMSEN